MLLAEKWEVRSEVAEKWLNILLSKKVKDATGTYHYYKHAFRYTEPHFYTSFAAYTWIFS